MEDEHDGNIPFMDYLKRLSTLLNEYYVEAKNALLRTEDELRITDEEPIDPRSMNISTLKEALMQVGFNDMEDLSHIACLAWLKKIEDTNRFLQPLTESYTYAKTSSTTRLE